MAITTRSKIQTIVLRFSRQTFYEQEDAFQLQVMESPEKLAGAAFRVNVEEFTTRFQKLFVNQLADEQFFYGSADDGEAKVQVALAELGNELYQLLPPNFRLDFPLAIQRIFERGHTLRLVFEANAGDPAKRLLNLPWELLFNQSGGVFMMRTPRVLIMRRLLEGHRRAPKTLTPPFNVLHVIADGIEADSNTQPANRFKLTHSLVEVEQNTIPDAIMPGQYVLVSTPGSAKQLADALETAQQNDAASNILHFLGHGKIDEPQNNGVGRGQGRLRFVTEQNYSEWISGTQLQLHLHTSPALQMVVLNACHGSANDTSGQASGSVALELIYNGLPYVVAMQGPILQNAAGYFIQAFYGALQRGESVEQAMADGRVSIATQMPQTLDWCLPVLYTNVGIAEPSIARSTTDRIWHLASNPHAQRRIGKAIVAFGAIQIIVGALLLISGQKTPVPQSVLFGWVTILLLVASFIIGIYTFWQVRTQQKSETASNLPTVLLVRMVGSAFVGVGLPTIFSWIFLWLLIAIGFWGLLSTLAQAILLSILFLPTFIVGASQATGHGLAFLSNAEVDFRGKARSEAVFSVAGILLIGLPWALMKFFPLRLELSWTNLIVGIGLVVIGWLLIRDELI